MKDTSAWDYFAKWAKETGVNHNTWLSWRKRGVPHWARLHILRDAKIRRVKIDPDAFDERPARENGT